jgi:hypothetical protein
LTTLYHSILLSSLKITKKTSVSSTVAMAKARCAIAIGPNRASARVWIQITNSSRAFSALKRFDWVHVRHQSICFKSDPSSRQMPLLQVKQAHETISPRSKVFAESMFGINRFTVTFGVCHAADAAVRGAKEARWARFHRAACLVLSEMTDG